jgi:hypothetical protein
MLRAEHHTIVYSKPLFRTRLSRGARTYRDAFRGLVAIHEVNLDQTVSHLRDSEILSLEEFVRRHEHDRQQLLMRKLRGEQLSPHEDVALQSINAQLERLLPAPEKRPDDVTLAVDEARRLLRRLENERR